MRSWQLKFKSIKYKIENLMKSQCALIINILPQKLRMHKMKYIIIYNIDNGITEKVCF